MTAEEQERTKSEAGKSSGVAPIIDVNAKVCFLECVLRFEGLQSRRVWTLHFIEIVSLMATQMKNEQGFFKVLGKGNLPNYPIIVKAKYFSKDAETKIKEAGGACILTA
jgi:ribosomal protein L15